MSQQIGAVVGEARPDLFDALFSRPARMGEYVIAHTQEGVVLGMVEDSTIENKVINIVSDYSSVVEAWEATKANPRDKSYRATVRVLGVLDMLKKGESYIPSVPPEPGSPVYEATYEELSSVFGRQEKGYVRVGVLLRAHEQPVPVYVNINKIASRHLAILAATGSGKSNLLALLAKRISELHGTMVLFDYHGEYGGVSFERAQHVEPKINPKVLSSDEFADMLDMPAHATRQRDVLRNAFNDNRVRASLRDFWEQLHHALEEIENGTDRESSRVAARLIEVLERGRARYGMVLDPTLEDPLAQIKEGWINIVDLSSLTTSQASLILSYYISEVLEQRKAAKKGYKGAKFRAPVIIAIEEAHVFLPIEDQGPRSDAIEAAAKVAREGRKFGVSLLVVSQRPSRLNQDVLSQMGSLAIMRITQPRDQDYVVSSTELVSERLARNLPALNVGEAILLGQWVSVPTLVKIDRVSEKIMGTDIDAASNWEDVYRSESSGESTEELMGGI